MYSEEIFGNIADKTLKINRYWQDNRVSSKAIREEIERVFKNDDSDFIHKAAYYYALKKRIKAKYGNILKKLFGFFRWKKETALLLKIKQLLNLGESSALQSVALQNGGDTTGGSDCGGSDGDGFDKNKKELQKNAARKPRKEEKTKPEKTAKFSENPYADLVDEIKREIGEESAVPGEETASKGRFEPTEPHKTDRVAVPDKNNSADGYIGRGVFEESQKTGERERIEIPKEDLLSGNKQHIANNKIIAENNGIKTGFKPTAEIAGEKACGEKIVNDFSYTDIQSRKSSSTERLSDNVAIDINLDMKKTGGDKPLYRSDGYCDKRTKTVVANERETYERQKREIAGEEIAKMSEDDIRAIKAVMEEEIDKQMADAEKNGEVYKMPVGIKEAIAPTVDEKSEAHTSNARPVISDNLTVDNKK